MGFADTAAPGRAHVRQAAHNAAAQTGMRGLGCPAGLFQ
jgi:hypothetical protein